MSKVDKVLDDLNKKLDKVDGVFDIVDRSTDTINMISNKIVDGVSGFIGKLFSKKREKGDDDE